MRPLGFFDRHTSKIFSGPQRLDEGVKQYPDESCQCIKLAVLNLHRIDVTHLHLGKC